MKNYDENKESSYIQYLDENNLHGWVMYQKLPADWFEWKKLLLSFKFDEGFIKNYDEDSDKGYILEVHVEYPKCLHDLDSDLPFLPERMKINKCNRLVCNLYDSKTLMLFTKSFKTTTRSWTSSKKVHRVIKFNQKTWLKSYININTRLRTEAKTGLKNIFLS